MSSQKKYGILLVLLFTVLVLVEYFTPKPINWDRTFSNKDKIPYGTYLLYELLPDIFPDQRIASVRQPVMNQLEENEESESSNYIFINQEFEIDSLDRDALLDYVKRGNNVFIAAEEYSELLENTLGFTVELSKHQGSDSLNLSFANAVSGPVKKFRYPFKSAQFYFEPKADTAFMQSVIEENASEKQQKSKLAFGENIQVLGRNSEQEPVFLKVKKGEGAFYLSSTPLVFCNYHTVLSRQNQYAAIAFSHLPVQPVLWDEYQKQGRMEDQSVLRVLMSHEPLSWAYYIALSGLFLFIIFESKRRQRIIPVWESPKNTTLEFVQVVGNLYFNYKNHKIIAEKKINYFFEFLRLHYFEQSNAPDVEFAERVAAKSGLELAKTEKLFAQVRDVRNADSISDQQLSNLNIYLEEFYRQAGK